MRTRPVRLTATGRVNAGGEKWSFDFKMEPPDCLLLVWNSTKNFKTVLEVAGGNDWFVSDMTVLLCCMYYVAT